MSVPYVELSHVARTVLFASAGALSAGEITRTLLQAARGRGGAERDSLRAEAVFRLLFVGGIAMLLLGRVLVPGAVIGGGVWVFAVGTVIAWLGLLLRWWSSVTLGRYFTVIVKTSEDQPVVDRGPYRVLRHPSYTGLLLAFTGFGLMTGNWISAIGAVGLMAVALVYRLRIEERALSAALGERYQEFAASRARLIPFVW